MVTEAHWQNWKADDFKHCLDTVFETFGPNKIMFGSDWPVCQVAATYTETMNIVSEYIAALSATEQAAVWGDNAVEFYNL
jgi:L-fuconolactonase